MPNSYKVSNVKIIEKIILGILWVTMIFSFSIIFKKEYVELVNYSFIIFILFMIISSFYFIFLSTYDERKILINMYIIYFSSILVLLTLLFTASNSINKIKLDYWKTEINVLSKNDKINAWTNFKTLSEQYIEQFQIKKVTAKNSKEIAESNTKITNTSNISIHKNFFMTLVLIISEFMVIWFLVEFNIIRQIYVKITNCDNLKINKENNEIH